MGKSSSEDKPLLKIDFFPKRLKKIVHRWKGFRAIQAFSHHLGSKTVKRDPKT